MAYTQLKKFSQAKAGKTKNFCLANVTQGYGIPNKYASAWEAWQNTQQHKGNPPAKLDVPVYFSYTATIDGINKNWGHIGVRLANGKFWSDGTTYPSISAYTTNHSPKYVGWGESVNGVKVIENKPQGVKLMLEEQPPVFNAKYYLNNNPDVNKRYNMINAKNHWLESGIKEGRPSAPNFHVKEYLANYGDLQRAYGKTGYAKAVKHYYNNGINENRSGRTIKPDNKLVALKDKIIGFVKNA